MVKVLETFDLTYRDFNNLNLSFESNSYYLIVGANNSGKTTLFRLLSSLIPTNDMIMCNNVYLDDNSILDYILNIGIVERVNKKSFLYQRVYDELRYPLYNLGYSKKKMDTRINEVLTIFNRLDILDKDISNLTYNEKQELLIMISLLHNPSVLLLDGINNLDNSFMKSLKKLTKDGLTVIDFNVSLDNLKYADKIILLDNFSIIGEYLPSKAFEDDKLFYEHHVSVPFLTDLAVKLKMYNLVNKEYTSMKAMVDDIWP